MAWTSVKIKMHSEVTNLQEIFADYSYADEAKALITDEQVCRYLIKELNEVKNKLFNVIDIAFERHPQLTKDFERMWDDVDIFSDEMKVHQSNFKQVPDEFLERIVRHDWDLVQDVQNVMKKLHMIYQNMLKYTPVRVRGNIAIYDPDFWKEVRKQKEEVKKDVVKMVIHFKEREILCNIKRVSLEKTYQRLRNQLQQQYGD